MALIFGITETRVTPVTSSGNQSGKQDEFGKWVHVPYFRAKNAATVNKAPINNQRVQTENSSAAPFATLLRQAEQNNVPSNSLNKATVLLKPANRAGTIDIIA